MASVVVTMPVFLSLMFPLKPIAISNAYIPLKKDRSAIVLDLRKLAGQSSKLKEVISRRMRSSSTAVDAKVATIKNVAAKAEIQMVLLTALLSEWSVKSAPMKAMAKPPNTADKKAVCR